MPRRLPIPPLLAVFVLAVLLLPACGRRAGTRSFGDPEDADYCNVLMVPTVAEEIGLDLPLRIRAATKGAELLEAVRNGPTRGSELVARYGSEARRTLPPEARSAFDRLFSSGKLVRVGHWTEKVESGVVQGHRYFVTYGWWEEEKDRVGQKLLSDLERELEACYRWIPSADDADLLLDHEDPVVKAAADRWWDDEEKDLDRAEAEQQRRERRAAFDRTRQASRRQHDEFRRRFEEKRASMTTEHEAFREEVRAHQEEVRRKIEEARARQRQR